MAVSWPDWVCVKGQFSELVRYINPADVAELALIPPGAWPTGQGEHAALAHERARSLYEALRARNIRYAEGPWAPEMESADSGPGTRRIRPPAEAVRGPSTRLDVALVFAAMALDAGLRTFLALDETTPDQPLIVIDLRRSLSEKNSRLPPGFAESPGEAGTFMSESAAAPLDRLTIDRDWLVIDPGLATNLAHREGTPFTEASGESILAEKRYAGSMSHRTWLLLDVQRIRIANVPSEPQPSEDVTAFRHSAKLPYEPPRGLAVPVIFSYLPPVPPFRRYPSRQSLLQAVEAAARPGGPPVVLVLQGRTGLGKSMIAHHMAAAADLGCGWMLNATDAEALRKSLARAQATEQSAQAELDDLVTSRALASEALRRLNTSEAPWVVVLDNCDCPPDEPGLRSLMPNPHRNGQLLIVTTAYQMTGDNGWRDYARREGWKYFEVPQLEQVDLDDLAIPAELHAAVDGRPLIAQVLSAVEARTSRIPTSATASTGPDLAWELMLNIFSADPAPLELARILAWCPSDPVPFRPALERLAGPAAMAQPLIDLRFVNLAQASGAPALQMHHLFGDAVRTQVWRDDPATAQRIVETLLTDATGREILIYASDGGALRRLENEDAGRNIEHLMPDAKGMIWYGLGTIREQRGPVTASKEPFEKSGKLLDRNKHPHEYAETLIGQARIIFQGSSGRSAAVAEVDEKTTAARQVLADLTDERARRLSERANALSLLMRRTAIERNPDRDIRRAQLPEIIEGLWVSYEQRVRIAQELPDSAPVERQAPLAEWGLDPDRAYFNLAGAYLALARTYEPDSDGLRMNLERAGAIYTDCRRLREQRYEGRPHPYLAACVNGEGLIAYYQGLMLSDQRRRLVDAIRHASTALAQRQEIASGLAGGDQAAILGEVDVRKSATLVMKATVAATMAGYRDRSDGTKAVREACEQAVEEFPDSL
jgi:hypothetical protein